jgi:Sec-independent protein translocase protein TatA
LSKGIGQAIRGFKQSLHEEPESDAKKIVEKEKES